MYKTYSQVVQVQEKKKKKKTTSTYIHMCTTSKANRAKWVKHIFFVQLLFLQLFCEFEIISKKKIFFNV